MEEKECGGFTSILFAEARIFCSSFRFLEMIMAMWTGSSWNRSWRDVGLTLDDIRIMMKKETKKAAVLRPAGSS